MRIYFSTLAHPMRFSQRLQQYFAVEGMTLAAAQKASARIYGYADWSELEDITARHAEAPSRPDEQCDQAEILQRRHFQAVRLFKFLGVKFGHADAFAHGDLGFAQAVVEQLRPTSFY